MRAANECSARKGGVMMTNIFALPGWGRSNPLAETERLRRELDRLAGGLFRRVAQAGIFPAVNLTEDRDNYYIRAELPGLDAADLDIQAAGNTLSLSGERKISAEENVKYHRREREAGRFSRIIHLPGAADTEKIEASLVNGILSISIPKSEAAKPRQIRVN